MKTKLSYTVRSTRAPGEATDTIVPVLVDRLQPVDLETVVENCIDRGLIAGLKPTAAHTIAEGVAAQLAREFSLGRGVMFGQYFYGRPYLSGVVGENGRVTSANKINVRLYKGELFKLALSDFSMNFDGSGDAVKIAWIMGDTSDAGGNTRGVVVAAKPIIVQGGNFWAAGDTNKVTLVEVGAASGSPIEVTQFTSQGPDILAFAWPSGLEVGKKYSVTVSRTDSNGITRSSSAKVVEVVGTPAPVVNPPRIDGAATQGQEDGQIEAPGGHIDVTGDNLDTATAVQLFCGEEGQSIEDMELWLTLPASWDSEGGYLTTTEDITDGAPGSYGMVRVTTAGGSADYPVQYTTH